MLPSFPFLRVPSEKSDAENGGDLRDVYFWVVFLPTDLLGRLDLLRPLLEGRQRPVTVSYTIPLARQSARFCATVLPFDRDIGDLLLREDLRLVRDTPIFPVLSTQRPDTGLQILPGGHPLEHFLGIYLLPRKKW